MTISVITTLYNYRNYIKECIESFLQQDFLDSEMIIVDDCSTDNPLVVIQKYLQMTDRIKYICLKGKANYSVAKNVGIRASNSEVLVMLDADDMFTDNSLSIRYEKLMEGYDFVHGPCLVLRDGKQYRAPVWFKYQRTKSSRDVHAQTVMLKKDIHRKIGLYDEDLRSTSDYEMWARIFNHGFKIGCVNKDVSIYRMHSKQMHKSKWKVDNLSRLTTLVNKKIRRRKSNLSGLELLI